MSIFIIKYFPPHNAIKVTYIVTKPNYLLFKNNLVCILLVYSLLRTIFIFAFAFIDSKLDIFMLLSVWGSKQLI